MKIALVTDEFHPINTFVLESIKKRGFHSVLFGSYITHKDVPWVEATVEAAKLVANGTCSEGIFFCWSGTGASIASNKVKGIRAALVSDAETARLSRTWNHANVLVLSNRSLTEKAAEEILDAWFEPYDTKLGQEGIEALNKLEALGEI
ncbi:MAG: RpiB/LacA/LacB family sugar-phosphate isomerase [Proteobacteria bacterium]|nr:RpiB/LacA/LacB family sugar-phosphate isomerase [Pseudomonadota bacterium]